MTVYKKKTRPGLKARAESPAAETKCAKEREATAKIKLEHEKKRLGEVQKILNATTKDLVEN